MIRLILVYVYLLYEVDVVNNTVFELSTTSREDEERTRFTNPILIFLVFYELRVRNIIIPNLKKHKNLERRTITNLSITSN